MAKPRLRRGRHPGPQGLGRISSLRNPCYSAKRESLEFTPSEVEGLRVTTDRRPGANYFPWFIGIPGIAVFPGAPAGLAALAVTVKVAVMPSWRWLPTGQ